MGGVEEQVMGDDVGNINNPVDGTLFYDLPKRFLIIL